MQYFKPSDIKTVSAMVQNITVSGFGLAADENGKLIFIPHRLIDQFKLDAGDEIIAYCVPSDALHNQKDKDVVAELRAIRLSVKKRLQDVYPEPKTSVPSMGGKSEMTNRAIKDMVYDVISEPRAWTTAQIRSEIVRRYPDRNDVSQDITLSITNALQSLHKSKEAALCRIFASGLQSTPSLVYWARSKQIFSSLIDGSEES